MQGSSSPMGNSMWEGPGQRPEGVWRGNNAGHRGGPQRGLEQGP